MAFTVHPRLRRIWITPPTSPWAPVLAVAIGLVSSGVAGGHPLDTWHLRTSPTTVTLRDVAYGASGFVIVGDGGTVLTSPDGVTWTSQVSGTTADLHGVTFGGLYVAVGAAGTILTSADGVAWSPRPSGTSRTLFDVAFGGGVFVAVGGCAGVNCLLINPNEGIILRSPDGGTWTPVTPFPLESVRAITFDGVGFTAAGTDFLLGDVFGCQGNLLTSPDGTSWANPDAVVECPQVVAVGNGVHLTVGLKDVGATIFAPDAATSSDGISWTSAPPPPLGAHALAFGDALFVAAPLASSPDGVTWTSRDPGVAANLKGVAYVNHGFIAVGDIGTILQSAPTSFADVPLDYWAFSFITTLYYAGVTAGCGGLNYCPESPVTREQMAVFLLKASQGGDYEPPPCGTAPFADVPCSNVFAPWIQDLVARGITAGCGGGNYCPTSPVTREQMAVFLLKTRLGPNFPLPACTTPRFDDVPCSSPFAPWIEELARRAITAGCTPSAYCPTSAVTRAQMAVFLVRTFGL